MNTKPNDGMPSHSMSLNKESGDVVDASQHFHLLPTRIKIKDTPGRHCLEIGFHAPAAPSSEVTTSVDLKGSLVFRNETTPRDVFLFVQSADYSGVKVVILDGSQVVNADCPLVHGNLHRADIGPYKFTLHWKFEGSATTVSPEDFTRTRHLYGLNTLTWPTVTIASEHCSMRPELLLPVKEDFSKVEGLRRELGRGAFGTVSMTLHDGKFVAVKEIRLDFTDNRHNKENRVNAMTEIWALKKLSHSTIIDLLGFDDQDPTRICIYMPLQRGTLMDFVDKEKPSTFTLERSMLYQMLRALTWLSSRNMCHRDVKPQNILYGEGEGGKGFLFQLADFGLAGVANVSFGRIGTVGYMAPEVLAHGLHTPKMDVWSLFITLVTANNWRYPVRFPKLSMLETARVGKKTFPNFAEMGDEDPNRRASAVGMVVENFKRQGPSGN
ncbi:kinase-like domain-containing protein [Ilyonectria sp. MPI-CAGE-AT-0026]|nr:kinase-like domain-containing protein [Ilyonectria sp. MPI-CAGE-AT-0026]